MGRKRYSLKVWWKLHKIKEINTCWWPVVKHRLAKGINGHTVSCSRCYEIFNLTPDYEPCRFTNGRTLPKWRYVMEQTREELQVAWGGFPTVV